MVATPDGGRPSPGGPAQSLPLGDIVSLVVGSATGLAQSVVQSYSRSAPSTEGARLLLADLVDVGMTTAGSVAKVVAAGLRGDSMPTAPSGAGSFPATPSEAEASPRVHAGATLRLPLVIENTAEEASPEVGFTGEVAGPDGQPVDGAGISFSPDTLVVAAHDFEKLTVRIRVPEDAEPGMYRGRIVGGDGWFATEVRYEVMEASALDD